MRLMMVANYLIWRLAIILGEFDCVLLISKGNKKGSFLYAVKKSYVVYLGAHSHDPDLSSVDFNLVTKSHYEFLGSFLGSSNNAQESIFYSYTRHINGFAANLEEEVAAEIAKHHKVLSVFVNSGSKLHTTRSWGFMGLEDNGVIPSNSIWNKARFGEGVIIGNLDTGKIDIPEGNIYFYLLI